MISGKSVLAIIPARGGSKGVPRKNLRIVHGRPLIALSIEQARKSKYIDRLILSSEDKEIIEIAKDCGCEVPFVRPHELAADSTPGIAPVLDALAKITGFDLVILLQPTSPLRTNFDIDSSIELLVRRQADACVSVTECAESPYWMYKLDVSGQLQPLVSGQHYDTRQELPKTYVLNGAIYLAKCEWLLKTKSFLSDHTIAFEMPKERSLDIDTEFDLKMLEAIYQPG